MTWSKNIYKPNLIRYLAGNEAKLFVPGGAFNKKKIKRKFYLFIKFPK